MTNDFTVADYLLTRLDQLNVEKVFQIPGDYVVNFTTALEKYPGNVRAVGAVNELDAAYAADGYARTHGLGAVSLQFGVSTFSALNAIAGAFVERSPVVVISAAPSAEDRLITNMYQVLYHHSTGNLKADQQIFEQVTVAAETLDNAQFAPEIIDRVLTAAITHNRPVYIAAYKEVWGYPCDPPPKGKLKAEKPHSDPSFLKQAVEAAYQMIDAADKPLILAGVEVLRFGMADLLDELIKETGILFTTTSLGKTVLSEDHPNFIGTYSDLASLPQTLEIVNQSDCFITLGAIITDDYLDFIEKNYGAMVSSNTEATRVGFNPFREVAFQDFLKALVKRFKKAKGYPKTFTAPAPPVYPEPWLSNSDPEYKDQPEVLTYNRFFQYSMQFLEENDMMDKVVMNFGVSTALYVATNIWGLPQGSFIGSAAWQCIGFETGVTSGAQMGSGKRSWTVAGDGGFMMVCQSLSTLARNQLNGVIFVMSNGVYAIEQVYVDIDAFKPQGTFDTFDILPKWDYMALAKAFGAKGYRATNPKELKKALREIKDLEKAPALVEVVIPEKDLARQLEHLAGYNFNP